MKTKFIIFFCVITLIVPSCTANGNIPLGEYSFPLKKTFTLQIDEDIDQMTPINTWLAVLTPKHIIAIDVATHEELWRIDTVEYEQFVSFMAVGDRLLYATNTEAFLINRAGEKNAIHLPSDDEFGYLSDVLNACSEYIYVVRIVKGKWVVEAYNYENGVLLWHMNVARLIPDVFCAVPENKVYIVKNDAIQALENSTGKFMWKIEGRFGNSTFENNVIYVREITDNQDVYSFKAINLDDQTELWETNIDIPPKYSVANLIIRDQFLIAYGQSGMLVIDKATGRLLWQADIGEEISMPPYKLDGFFYMKSINSHAVYALSVETGSLIGYTKVENTNLLENLDATEGVYILDNQLFFDTKHTIVFYEE